MKLLVVILATFGVFFLSCNAEKQLAKDYDNVAADAPAPAPKNKNKLLPYFNLNFPTQPKTVFTTEYIKGDIDTVVDSAALKESEEKNATLERLLKNIDTSKCKLNVDSIKALVSQIKKSYAKALARVDSLKQKIEETVLDNVLASQLKLQIANMTNEGIKKDAALEKQIQKTADAEKGSDVWQKRFWILLSISLGLIGLSILFLYLKSKFHF
jgi:hypothetical protein